MAPSQVLRVWDGYLDAGTRKYFTVKPVSGDVDLALALYGSDPGTTSTWVQSRSQALTQADASGPGGDEYLDYESSTGDWMGLVVWNDGATSATTFALYADTSAPIGSITINNGAAYASSTSANLILSASDGGAGVGDMRFSDDDLSWSAWES